MLEGMRRHANSFVMSLMFGVIILVFIFSFGPGSAKYCGKELPQAATVNGIAISAADFQQQYARMFGRMQQMRPNYSVETARSENLKSTVLEQLVSQELLVQEAERRGIVITDEELAQEIVKLPLFQKDGAFDRQLYRRYATSLNLSEAGFEHDFRRDLLAQRMREILRDTVAISEAEIKQLWQKRNNKADIWFVKADPQYFKKSVEVDAAAAKSFASEQRARVEDYYNQHANDYNKPERIRVRHILIKVAKDAPEAEASKARERIAAAKKRIDGGEDFAAVARDVSEDSSAGQGGDLGVKERGTFVKEFEDAAFALEPGKISDIVRTQFGFHLIKLDSKIAAETQTVDEVAEDIAKKILVEDQAKEQAKAAAVEWLVRLKEADDPAALDAGEEAAKDPFAPKVESTGSFEQGARFIAKIGVAPEIASAAFALSDEAPTPEQPIESKGRYYAIKLKSRERPDPATFDEDKERLRTELMARRQMRIVEDFIEGLRKKATVRRNQSLVSYRDKAGA